MHSVGVRWWWYAYTAYIYICSVAVFAQSDIIGAPLVSHIMSGSENRKSQSQCTMVEEGYGELDRRARECLNDLLNEDAVNPNRKSQSQCTMVEEGSGELDRRTCGDSRCEALDSRF